MCYRMQLKKSWSSPSPQIAQGLSSRYDSKESNILANMMEHMICRISYTSAMLVKCLGRIKLTNNLDDGTLNSARMRVCFMRSSHPYNILHT